MIGSSEFWSAIIGGAFTYLAVFTTESLAKERESDAEQKKLKQLAMALRDEINTVWALYQQSIGQYLSSTEDGQPFEYVWPITGDYFLVYKAKAGDVVGIEDNELRSAIVRFYTAAAGHIDSLKYNNHLLNQAKLAAENIGGENVYESTGEYLLLKQYGTLIKSEQRALARDKHFLDILFESYIRSKPVVF